jgi:hypothetical protein
VHENDERERRRDCSDLAGNPVVVVLVFFVGLIVFLWGLWSAASYLAGRDRNLGLVWWQSSVAFVCVTLIAFCLPYRLRFAFNLYGIIFVMLIVEWGLFAVCFPISWISAEQIDTVRLYAKMRGEEHALPANPVEALISF